MRSTSSARSKRSDDSRDIHFHTQFGLWPAAATSMTDEEIAALLASPVGRRMVKAMLTTRRHSQVLAERDRRNAADMLAAALRVATDTTCPTCKGAGMIVESWGESFSQSQAAVDDCPNPNCKDGKVPPAFYTQEDVLRLTHKEYIAGRKALEETRAEVVAEIVSWMREPDLDSIAGHAARKAWADRIERRERER